MKNIGDYVVYKRDVCIIKNVYTNDFNGILYYDLYPIYDETLKISIPTDNKNIRDIISKKEADDLIDKISDFDVISVADKQIENEYKNLLSTNNIEDLIVIIKTSYLRNKDREENNKKIGEKDKFYFDLAEKFLYSELSLALNKTIDETKEYIINKLNS